MLKSLLHRLRMKRPSPPDVPAIHVQKASVEEIWSTWRFETRGSDSPIKKSSYDYPIMKTGLDSPARTFRFEHKRSSSRVEAGPASVEERVAQLKRMGEYEKALELALLEIAREERQRAILDRRVHWYYWEAAIILRRLKRFDAEVALVRRFARNYDLHFRNLSRRHRSMRSPHDAWAASFLGRLEEARTASEKQAKETKP